MIMCHLSQVLVKTEAAFSLFLNLITEIISRITPQTFCCCNHRMFDLNVTGLDKLLPIMYGLPKMHKTSIGARFIVASNYCSTKPLSDTTPKLFKIIFNTVEIFHRQSLCHSGCEKFWVMQNSFPIATKINKSNVKKKAKSVSAFEFSILSKTIPHKLLLNVLSEVINFVFKSKVRKRIGLSKHISIGLLRELEEDTSLNKLLSINKCFFTLLVAWFLNKILVYQWELTQHHYGRTSFFNSLNLII